MSARAVYRVHIFCFDVIICFGVRTTQIKIEKNKHQQQQQKKTAVNMYLASLLILVYIFARIYKLYTYIRKKVL